VEWTTGLEYWNGLLELHFFGFYTFLGGLIDFSLAKKPSRNFFPTKTRAGK